MDDSRRCRAMSKRSGEQCKRAAIVGGFTCTMHGGASPAVRAAAARRRAEAQATALLTALWDPDAEPITDPVSALQALAGRLENASRVLGARLDAEGVDMDGPTGLAWARVIRELRMSLVEMERLGLSRRAAELAEGQAQIVVLAFRAALDAGGTEVLPAARALMVSTFLEHLAGRTDPAPVVRGEVLG